jgi:catechol 2,3-dioxygenase-like lactoylglutathione lyase family enzyme
MAGASRPSNLGEAMHDPHHHHHDDGSHDHDHHHDDEPGRMFSHAIPILRVADFDASVAYYTEQLGFTLEWAVGNFGSVGRDHTSLMLCEGSQGHPGTWLWVGVRDADAVHDEFVRRGARIRHPPTNYPWHSREVHVFDLDGHVLRFGSESAPNAPLGPWLDEQGVLWQPHGDGSWTRVDAVE